MTKSAPNEMPLLVDCANLYHPFSIIDVVFSVKSITGLGADAKNGFFTELNAISPNVVVPDTSREPEIFKFAVIVPPDLSNLFDSEFVIVDEYVESSFNAAANSFNVSNAPGAPPTIAVVASATAFVTYAVVATFVLLSAGNTVGDVTVPVNVGLNIGAFVRMSLVLAVIALACPVVIPTFAVLATTEALAETRASVYPTFAVLAVIALACPVVIPTFAVLATTEALAETRASVYPTFAVLATTEVLAETRASVYPTFAVLAAIVVAVVPVARSAKTVFKLVSIRAVNEEIPVSVVPKFVFVVSKFVKTVFKLVSTRDVNEFTSVSVSATLVAIAFTLTSTYVSVAMLSFTLPTKPVVNLSNASSNTS